MELNRVKLIHSCINRLFVISLILILGIVDAGHLSLGHIIVAEAILLNSLWNHIADIILNVHPQLFVVFIKDAPIVMIELVLLFLLLENVRDLKEFVKIVSPLLVELEHPLVAIDVLSGSIKVLSIDGHLDVNMVTVLLFVNDLILEFLW